MNTPPRTAQPVFYLRFILHGTVSPPPLYNSCSSASTIAPCLSPAIVVLCLCHRSFVDCCFVVVVVSAVVASLPPTVHRVSSAAIVLQPVTPPAQPLCPASCQPSSLSAFATAHLLIVVFAIVVIAVVAPLPPTVHCVSSADVVLHLIRRHPPPHPTIVPSPLLCVLCIS
jgi:hypothetical protein